MKYITKNYLLAASSESNPKVICLFNLYFKKGMETENTTGIVSSHCYAILDARPVKGSDGKPD